MRMMTNHGAPIPRDQIATITEYLIKNFPEKAKPAGAVINGPLKVAMKTWPVPTPARGRTIRWRRGTDRSGTAARWPMCWAASIPDRQDQGIPLKTAHSGPHGLVEDANGNIWYTGNTGALIGKLDPKTARSLNTRRPTRKRRTRTL